MNRLSDFRSIILVTKRLFIHLYHENHRTMNQIFFQIRKFPPVLLVLLFISNPLAAQNANTKTVQAVRTSRAPVIDGIPEEQVWQQAPPATGFYEFQPGDGTPLPKEFDTQVRVLYDNAYIYIAAEMKDPQPDKIVREFGLRDQFTLSDYFAIVINPFRAPGNNYMFIVQATGAQIDGLQGKKKADLSWNAVWKSAVKIRPHGWSVEVALPYSALRFPRKAVQEWAIGFTRNIGRTRQQFSWTRIDKTKDADVVEFLGRLTGLQNIKPPLRLSLYPYASLIMQRQDGQNQTSPAFGMDLKYGLNENFTLDATLIPDFSDVPYDDVRLNLGPFEQYYNEKRQFFTEGTQLFSKGRLLYTRRIGGRPIDYYKVFHEKRPSEIILENPEKTRLINAIKLSGRTTGGWGLGVMNAFVNKAYATLKDTLSGHQRQVLTQPYTNYNMLVAEYSFGRSNSVALVNANTLRAGSARDANVTALVYDLYAQKNTLNISGAVKMSYLHDSTSTTGKFLYTEVSKTLKKHTFGVELILSDDKFNSNDLGFMRKNNLAIYNLFYKYRILKPTKHLNNFSISAEIGLDHIYKPYGLFRKDFYLRTFMTNKKFISYGGGLGLVSDTKDYYEPRVPGRVFIEPAHGSLFAFVSTDYRKKFALDVSTSAEQYFGMDWRMFELSVGPRFKFSERFNLQYRFSWSRTFNERGFVTINGSGIIFGQRDIFNITQSMEANYYFNVRNGLNLSLRHYWSPVAYNRFYFLQNDGSLAPSSYTGNHDFTFNVWNFDLGYSWEFAPGSRLNILYRNSIFNSDLSYQPGYGQNLRQLFRRPQKNMLIIKAIYYLDVNTVKGKWF